MVWSRRKGGLRQKPWNKAKSEDKFWVPSEDLNIAGTAFNDGTVIDQAGVYVASYDGQTLAQTASGGVAAGQAALLNCRLHRFDGPGIILTLGQPDATLDQIVRNDTDGIAGGQSPLPQVLYVLYAWLKLKESVNTFGLNGVPSAPNYSPSLASGGNNQLRHLLLRRDILRWGMVPVYGANSRQLVLQNDPTAGSDVASEYAPPVLSPTWDPRLTRIPFPRVPKGGFIMKSGETLVCVAAGFNGPWAGGATTGGENQMVSLDTRRKILARNMSRALCSL